MSGSRIIRTYVAAEGSRINDQDAEIVGSFLEDRFGDLGASTDEIVNAARPKRSAIHRFFEWDDPTAAEEYRKQQARNLVGAIWVVVQKPSGDEFETRAYQHVRVVESPDPATPRYMPAHVVWSDPDLSHSVAHEALRELTSWARSYEQYSELQGTAQKVRVIVRELTDMSAQMEWASA